MAAPRPTHLSLALLLNLLLAACGQASRDVPTRAASPVAAAVESSASTAAPAPTAALTSHASTPTVAERLTVAASPTVAERPTWWAYPGCREALFGARARTPTSMTLVWEPAVDNVGVVAYEIYGVVWSREAWAQGRQEETNLVLMGATDAEMITSTGLLPATYDLFKLHTLDAACNRAILGKHLVLPTIDDEPPSAPSGLADCTWWKSGRTQARSTCAGILLPIMTRLSTTRCWWTARRTRGCSTNLKAASSGRSQQRSTRSRLSQWTGMGTAQRRASLCG